MKKVMPKLFSSCQTTFVQNRQTIDGVLAIYEIMDFARWHKKEYMLIKLDFEKAYERVSWAYIRDIIRITGFRSRWMSGMESCVFISSMLILINGSSTVDFKAKKFLRQGDSMPPFLFLLVAKGHLASFECHSFR